MKQMEGWHLPEKLDKTMGQDGPFAAAVRGTSMPMILTDPRMDDNPITFANDAFLNLTGYARDEVLGRNCRFLQGPDTDPESLAKLRRAIGRRQAVQIDLLNYRKDGAPFWNALYVSPVHDAAGNLEFYFASQLDVTDRIEATARVEALVATRTADLEAALDAKTVLLSEVDHRVKNNLTMIGTLLRLQSRSQGDTALRRTLDTMLSRVDALAAVHRKFYQSDQLSEFRLDEFAAELVNDVVGASGRGDISVEMETSATVISSEKAAPIGLILNELVTNAIKHAYADGRSGVLFLRVAPSQMRGGCAIVELADDGPGFDLATTSSGSIGRSLVERLSGQLEAEVEWDSSENGTRVSLWFAAHHGQPKPSG